MTAISINYHLLAPCNMSCGGCFAHFYDDPRAALRYTEIMNTIRRLAHLSRNFTHRKITFSGGEPTLLPQLPDYVAAARDTGFVTGVITNGSRLSNELMRRMAPNLDWLGVSVDSIRPSTNAILGRTVNGHPLSEAAYYRAASLVHEWGCHLKVNTVVSSANCHETLTTFIDRVAPKRWKIMEHLEIFGENAEFANMRASPEEFEDYAARNWRACAVAETAESMIDSYFMISPSGAIVSNTRHNLRYRASVHHMDTETFEDHYRKIEARLQARGGLYPWIRRRTSASTTPPR